MYEVAPSILESRLLGSNNIVDAAVVGIPDKENGQVKTRFVFSQTGDITRDLSVIFFHCLTLYR
jgi:acyl-coenzyme A synthetase/AMP-(fatty) acid ligase